MTKYNGFVPSEKEMQAALFRWAMWEKNHPIAIPNTSGTYGWEADLLSLTNSNYAHEFEIKRSIKDYKQDFTGKRAKHELLRGRLANWNGHSNGTTPAIPNYFWFVTFEGMEIEPPEYAGWLVVRVRDYKYLDDRPLFLFPRVIKKAPLLHKEKMPYKEIVAINRRLSFRIAHTYIDAYPCPQELQND